MPCAPTASSSAPHLSWALSAQPAAPAGPAGLQHCPTPSPARLGGVLLPGYVQCSPGTGAELLIKADCVPASCICVWQPQGQPAACSSAGHHAPLWQSGCNARHGLQQRRSSSTPWWAPDASRASLGQQRKAQGPLQAAQGATGMPRTAAAGAPCQPRAKPAQSIRGHRQPKHLLTPILRTGCTLR